MNNLMNLLTSLSNTNLTNDADIEELDLSKDEDLEKFINTANSIKETSKLFDGPFGSLFSGLFDIDINSTIDNLINSAKDLHDKLNKDKKQETKAKRPSENVSPVILKNIANLTTEYVDTVLSPYIKFTDDQRKSIYECLTEFGCWIYSHK